MNRNSIHDRWLAAANLVAQSALCYVALLCSYGTYKLYLSAAHEVRLSRALRDEIKATFPWATLLFLAVCVLSRLWNRRRKPRSRVRLYAESMAIYCVALNLVFFGRGATFLVPLNFSLAYLCLFLLVLELVNARSGKLTVHIPKLHSWLGGFASKRSALVVGAVVVLSVAVPALILSELLVQRRNTLHENGRWISSKVSLERGVVGAVSYFITRTALSGNTLGLGSWHGYQEVLFGQKLNPVRVEFDFLVRPASYVVFVYNKDEAGFSGFRITSHDRFDSISFAATSEGRFTKLTKLTVPRLSTRWNHATVEFHDGAVSLAVNGQSVARESGTVARKQWIGFRGSEGNSYVDNVRIVDRASSETIDETFRRREGWFLAFVILVAAILGADIIVYCLASRTSRRPKSRWKYYLLAANFYIFLFSGVLFLFDHFYLAGKHSQPRDFRGYTNTIETSEEIRTRLRQRYSTVSGDAYRVLFIGSSQTWGAGATTVDDTFVRRVERRLNDRAGDPSTYECINAGISSLIAPMLVSYYLEEWIEWNPRIVVVNLSNNDSDLDLFADSLEKLAVENDRRGIQTIFVQEPNRAEGDCRSLRQKHRIMRDVGEKHSVPVVDMHADLERHHDEGFMWWDFVHLTSFGQELFAQALYPEIEALLSP